MDKAQTEPQQKHSPLQTFLDGIQTIKGVEEKLKACIDYMQNALSQHLSPDFKGFWHVRKLCFPFFKEQLSGQVRADMWAFYVDLTKEGRRLKNLLDEESSFAATQIDLAIVALEQEVGGPKAVSLKMPKQPKALEGRYTFYETHQQELCGLNVFASRINALRKELVKTEMRIRQKNKFFTRLSALGDVIFPRRKDLIKEISETFLRDVEEFTESHFSAHTFSEEKARRLVFFYREEIKGLQALAKMLTINTHAFTTTRQSLSECWDMLRGMEKELKKEHAHQKQKSQENKEAVLERMAQIASKFENKEISCLEGLSELQQINQWMREVELTRGDVHELKAVLLSTRQPLEIDRDKHEQKVKDKEAEIEQERKDRIEEFNQKLDRISSQVAEISVEELKEGVEACRTTLNSLSITKTERQLFDRKMREIRDLVVDKEEIAVLSLSDAAREQLGTLQNMLEQRQLRRKEIKGQIEEYRRTIGGSNLDFEKAMKYNELMAVEKESLEKTDASIVEIEKKIKEVKNQP